MNENILSAKNEEIKRLNYELDILRKDANMACTLKVNVTLNYSSICGIKSTTSRFNDKT